MTPEQLILLGGLALSVLVGAREVAKYVWGKFKKYVAGIEAQLEELVGTPARDGEPAKEGKIPKLERRINELSTDNTALTVKVDRIEQERDGAVMALDLETVIRKRAEGERDTAVNDKTQLEATISTMQQQLDRNTTDIKTLKDTHDQEVKVLERQRDDEHNKRVAAESDKLQLNETIEGLKREITDLETRLNARIVPLENNSKGDTGPLPSID